MIKQHPKRAKVCLIATLLLISQLIVITSYFLRTNHQESNYSLADALIAGWTKTDAFMDDVYTFNTHGIHSSLQRFIAAYEESDIHTNMCIQVTINSFDSNDRDITELCTKDSSIPRLTASASSVEMHSNSLPITIATKQLATVNYYLTQKPSSFSSQYTSIDLSLFLVALVLTAMAFVIAVKEIMVSPSPVKESLQSISPELPAERQQLENIGKIINSNKRLFALNEDVVLISYHHPYSNVIYKSGLSTKLKCSLVDLEQSFPLALVRINRSTLVNQELLQVGDNIDIKALKNGHLVIISVKGQKHELKVSNHYKDNLLSVISRGK